MIDEPMPGDQEIGNEQNIDGKDEYSIGPSVDLEWQNMLTFLVDLMRDLYEQPDSEAMDKLIDQLQREKDALRRKFNKARSNDELRIVQEELRLLTNKIKELHRQSLAKESQ